MTNTTTLVLAAQGPVPLLIAAVALLGVGSQWLAWRMKMPSILLLLLTGLLVGPVFREWFPESQFAQTPDEVIGKDLLLALVNISVALILYEGGLTLRFREIRGVKKVVIGLVSVGALVTWLVGGIGAWLVFGLSPQIAVLLGAILIVTGPTVIGPMLAHIRPAGSIGPILKWEGIVIDPIGVLAAVLVFEVISIGQAGWTVEAVVVPIAKTVIVGGGLGAMAAVLLRALMGRFLIPDPLQNPVSLMLVIVTATVSDAVQREAGLFAATTMGIVLANQSATDIRHIIEFKENLRTLLISALFIVLGARLEIDQLKGMDWGAVAAFLLILIVVARPLCVLVSTIGAGLSWNQKLFLSLLAPRGIVAAAAASIFALGLKSEGVEGAEQLVPLTFAVIIFTVAFYGLLGAPIAKALGVSDQNPQGLAFVGAPAWARSLAQMLEQHGVPVVLIDTNRANVAAARMAGLRAEQANVLAEDSVDELDLRGIGRVVAATPNDEVNALALQRFAEIIDKSGLFWLPARPVKQGDEKSVPRFGRRLFNADVDYSTLESAFDKGWILKATALTEEFDFKDYCTLYGPHTAPMVAIRQTGAVSVATPRRPLDPAPGDTIIALVNPDELLIPGLLALSGEVEQDDPSQG